MKRFRLAGLAAIAAFASFAAITTSAFALELPENLPTLAAGETRTFTAVSGATTTTTTLHAEGQEVINCSAAPGEGTEETSKPPKGAFHIKFENCTTSAGGVTVKCTGLGDANGVILALGTWALVFDKLIGKPFEGLTTAILFKNELVHFTCGGLVLVEVLAGETLCLHLNPTTKSAKHEFHCIGEILGGVPKPVEEWGTDVGGVFTGGKVPALKCLINHAASEVPCLQLGLGVITTLKGGVQTEIFADQ
jgi:hypothetical protein